MAKKPKPTNEEPLEKQFWKTADKLRKNIDAAESKRLCDCHDIFKFIILV